MTDRSDPGARAEQRLHATLRRDRGLRLAGAMVLVGIAVAALATAGPLTGRDGAWVGAVVLACALGGLAAALWPAPPSTPELRHHELDAIWRELRDDADEETPWPRFAAWAASSGTRVELWLIERASVRRVAGAPSPYRVKVEQRLEAEELAAAAEAMEQLRASAEQRELEARQAHAHAQVVAEHVAHDRALSDVERAAAGYQHRREEAMRRELADQESAERAAQAQALARALRRP